VQVDPVKPMLKPPGTKHWKLKCDELLSSFAFKFNLRRYIQVEANATVSPPGGMQMSFSVYFNPGYSPSGFETILLDAAAVAVIYKAKAESAGFGATIGRVIARDVTRRYYGPAPSPPPPAPPPHPEYPPGAAPPPTLMPPPPLTVNANVTAAVFETYLGRRCRLTR